MKSPNRYFNHNNFGPTQKLYEDLIVEAIRIHGTWVNYIPFVALNQDDLFGESSSNRFEDSIKIEAYINNTKGFDGQRMMSKFGVQIQDEVKFTIAQRRFEEVRAEHLLTETGHSMEQEITSRYHAGQFNGILLEEGNIEGYYYANTRPTEGDLIWVPLFQRMFEIKFVQHDAIFYQGGSLQTYDIFCDLFEYGHDKFDTGDSAIDSIEDLFSGDILRQTVTTEGGDDINVEDGGTLIQDGIEVEDSDNQASNNVFKDEVEGVVDFSEKSPFVKRNTMAKW